LDDYIGPAPSDFTIEGRNMLKTTRFNFQAKNEKEPAIDFWHAPEVKISTAATN
jgi:hypothetical protein